MKKFGIGIVLLLLGGAVFAFDQRGEADVPVYPEQPPLRCSFFAFDLNGILDIVTLGVVIAGGINSPVPVAYWDNNMDLSQAVKNKMKQLKANVCLAEPGDGYVYINILMPAGTYSTVVYAAKQG